MERVVRQPDRRDKLEYEDADEIFQEFEDEFIRFDRVENKLSSRPDIHAFILLNQLVPGNRNMVGCAEHDEIWLDIDVDKLKAVATKEQLRELHRCGVRYDRSVESLAMFV